MPPEMMPLLLASASPRRREMLQRVGLRLEVCPAHVDEDALLLDAAPEEGCLRVALRKAETVLERAQPHQFILAADTIVVVDGLALGKPSSEADALQMLERLNGRTHQVMTGFVVRCAYTPLERAQVVTTGVTFRRLERDELEAYVATGEPMDKAGAYGIQGVGALLVERVSGSYTNVVGLPLSEVLVALSALGGPRPLGLPSRQTF